MIAWTFHHIGLACHAIEAETPHITALGYIPEGELIEDPIQKVRLLFMVGPGPRLELIEPTAAASPVSGVLKRGQKFYHMAFECAAFDEKLVELTRAGYLQLGTPVPAVAFGMRKIVFLLSPAMALVEVIEAPQ